MNGSFKLPKLYTFEKYECAYKNSLVKIAKNRFDLFGGRYMCEMQCILKDYGMNDTYTIDVSEDEFYNALSIITEKTDNQFNKFNSLIDIMAIGFGPELKKKMEIYVENLNKDEN
jgi:hypothetical protein